MANPGQLIVNPMALWGTILSGAQNGLNTQSLFASIRTQMETSGVGFGPSSVPDIGHLWGMARGMVNASNALAAAPSGFAITSDMIGVAPYGGPAAGNFGAPRYNVRTFYQTTEGGEIVTRSYVDHDVDLSTVTVGELRAQAYSDATDAATRYPNGLVGEPVTTIEQV